MTYEDMRTEIIAQTDIIKSRNREHEVIKVFQTKWQGRILFELLERNPLRFGEIQHAIPNISNAMLSLALRNLEKLELISRTQYNEMPLRVEYTLTERGSAMLPIFYEMIRWEKFFMPELFEPSASK